MSRKSVRISLLQFAVAMLLAALVAWTGGTTMVWAQRGASNALGKSDVMKILREQNIPAAQKADFQNYFTKGFFPYFNSAGPASYEKYYRLRGQLKIYLNTARSGQAHDELNRLTLSAMKSIVGSSKSDNGAKINAMYVIGELNEDDEPGKVKPLGESFDILYFVLRSDKFKDALKVPALVGLERFAAADAIPATKKDEVTKFMVDLVNQQSPPADRSAAGHDWMRRGAARVLAKMGSAGPNNSVVKAFVAIVDDPPAGT